MRRIGIVHRAAPPKNRTPATSSAGIQKLLGHSSIQTTADIYVDWDIDQLRETMAQVAEGDET
jgi:integrase